MDFNLAQIFIQFAVLLFSLTIHEMAHAWTADRLGDPTARLLGRVSLNPIVHADLICLATPYRRRGREQTQRQYGGREQKNRNRSFLELVHSLSIAVL